MHVGGLAGVDRHLLALLELDVLAVLPRLRHTVGRLLHLAAEGVGHLGVGLRLWLVIPDLLQLVRKSSACSLSNTHLLVLACDLRDDEVNILGDQLTLLPGDWLTGLSPSPHLGTSAIKYVACQH